MRRGDILYYFSSLCPELVTKLKPEETLSLLTYHWPGNVREVERIGLLLERNNEKEYRLSYMLESTHHVIKMSMSDLTKSRENIVKNMILPFDFNSIWFDIFYCVTPVSAHKNHPPCFRKFLICWDIK